MIRPSGRSKPQSRERELVESGAPVRSPPLFGTSSKRKSAIGAFFRFESPAANSPSGRNGERATTQNNREEPASNSRKRMLRGKCLRLVSKARGVRCAGPVNSSLRLDRFHNPRQKPPPKDSPQPSPPTPPYHDQSASGFLESPDASVQDW